LFAIGSGVNVMNVGGRKRRRRRRRRRKPQLE
jgi:hypothetical protein